MTICQASADYAREQAKREALDDERARWADSEPPEPTSEPNKVCAQCVNWRPERPLHLADGTTRPSPGFCASRAAAALPQMLPAYAERCRLFEEEIPF